MSEIKFLFVNGLIYKCHIDTTRVEFKKKYIFDNDSVGGAKSVYSLLIHLKCPMSSLSMSQHDLLNMLLNNLIDIDTCYKYTPNCNMLTEDDEKDISIDLSFKHLIKMLHITPGGTVIPDHDTCIVSLKDCFYDSDVFNIVERVKSDSYCEKDVEVTKPIKIKKIKYYNIMDYCKCYVKVNIKCAKCDKPFKIPDSKDEAIEELKKKIKDTQVDLVCLKMELRELENE